MKIYKFLAFGPTMDGMSRDEVFIKSNNIEEAESKLTKLGYFSVQFVQLIEVIE